MATKSKPVPGHKRARVTFSVSVTCECGWRSGNWSGKGARTQAHNEWRWHVDECVKTAPVQQAHT